MSLVLRLLVAVISAVFSLVSTAQLYDTPESRRQKEEVERKALDEAKRNSEPKKPTLEEKKAEAMEYLGKKFQFHPNPSASDRIRFYERIPPSSHSQDPSYLFTPLTVTTFVVRGVIMAPPVIYAPGEDEYLLEIEFPDGKVGYVNVVGCCGLRENTFKGELNNRKEFVQPEGAVASMEELLAKQKKRDEEQARKERLAKQEAERKQQLAREKAQKENLRRAALPAPRLGMTRQQVVNESNWGRPYDVHRTTTVSGVREQWVYGDSRYLYFENGVLTAIQD